MMYLTRKYNVLGYTVNNFIKNIYYPQYGNRFRGNDYSHIKYIFVDDLDGKKLEDFYETLFMMKIPKDVVIIRLYT